MIVFWTESALADLQAVEANIARHSSRYAQTMIARIFDRSQQLESHPQSGPVVPEFSDESLRELFEDPYRIVYRLDDEKVNVVAVVHAARRLPRGL